MDQYNCFDTTKVVIRLKDNIIGKKIYSEELYIIGGGHDFVKKFMKIASQNHFDGYEIKEKRYYFEQGCSAASDSIIITISLGLASNLAYDVLKVFKNYIVSKIRKENNKKNTISDEEVIQKIKDLYYKISNKKSIEVLKYERKKDKIKFILKDKNKIINGYMSLNGQTLSIEYFNKNKISINSGKSIQNP